MYMLADCAATIQHVAQFVHSSFFLRPGTACPLEAPCVAVTRKGRRGEKRNGQLIHIAYPERSAVRATSATSTTTCAMSLQIFDVDQLLPDPDLDGFRQNAPDKCLFAGESRCGIWFARPGSNGERYGVIGHYGARDGRQSQALLTAACDLLRDGGCSAVYGPMDGNTWKSYRFVTWSNGSPPFLMEPRNPPQWPEYWRQSGFAPSHEYISTLVTDLASIDPRLVKARTRLQEAGITWRPVDLGRFEDELKQVYRLSLAAFKKNVLYAEIDETSFLRQYLPFAGKIDAGYVLLAHDAAARCCGFIFAIPDLLQLQQGSSVDRLVIKTLAVHSHRSTAGLGAVLVDEVQRTAAKNGFTSAIHALMYAGNVSANIGKGSTLLRRYALFGKTLS